MINFTNEQLEPLVVEERRQDSWFVSYVEWCNKLDPKPIPCELPELPAPTVSFPYSISNSGYTASNVSTSTTTT